MPTASEIQSFIDKLTTNMSRFDGIVNGPVSGPTSLITTDSGPVKSVARVLDDLFATGTRFYNTITQVQGLTVPSHYNFIFVSGRSAPGSGGQYYARKASSAHPFKFSDASGAIWEPTSDIAMLTALTLSSGGLTIGVGTTGDYPDYQAAADALRPYQVKAGQRILIAAVSPLLKGWITPQGVDDSKFVLVNATGQTHVTLASGFEGVSDVGLGGNERTDNLIAGFYSSLPTLGCTINMNNTGGSGYYGINGCSGMVLQGCGVINAGYNGLEWRGAGGCAAYKSVWSGATNSGIRVAHAASVAAQESSAINCCKNPDAGETTGAVDVSRLSTLHFRLGKASGSGGAGANVRRASRLCAEEADFSNAAAYGMIIQHASQVSAWGSKINNTRKDAPGSMGYGVWVRAGIVDLQGADIVGSAGAADVRIGDSSPANSMALVNVSNVATTNGTNAIQDYLGVDRFNLQSRYGQAYNAAVAVPLDIGVFSLDGLSRGWDWDRSFNYARSSANTTSATTHWGIWNPNGQVGVVTSIGTATQFTTLSDGRRKTNIVDADIDIEEWIEEVRVREYDMLDLHGEIIPDSHSLGFVAQELHSLAPRAVAVGGGEYMTDTFVPWGVDEGKMVPYLVLSIKHLLAEIRALRLQIEGES